MMNGVKVVLKNPGTDGLKDFLIVNKAISKMPKVDVKGLSKEQAVEKMQKEDVNFMEFLDDKAMDSLKNLITLSLKKTYGTITEEIDQWAMKNFMTLINEVLTLCSPDAPTDDQNLKEALKEKIQKDHAESTPQS